MNAKLHVLALAPYCDGLDVGEAWCAHQWISNLSRHARVTLLTLRRDGQVPASRQLPNVEVVEWGERLGSQRFSRLSSMLKPSYLGFYMEARRWIARALRRGMNFDIAHQFSPIALRYPTPLAEFQIPYVIGPLGGSLDTPPGFAAECRSSAWYTHLRRLDHWRLRRDPTLRGKILIRLSIEPDGSVSMCQVESTDLASDDLVAKIIGRIKKFNFGQKDGVSVLTILYPIDFLPAG